MMKKELFYGVQLYNYFFLSFNWIFAQSIEVINDDNEFTSNNVMVEKMPFPYSDKIYSQHALLVEILQFCKWSDYRTILIFDDENKNSIIKLTKNMEKVNVILHSLMKLSKKSKHIEPRAHEIIFRDKHFFHKIDIVAITIMRSYQMTNILNALTLIEFWNVTTPFFILNKSDKNCINARGHFKITWRFYLAAPYYICMNDDKMMIYTYNPYVDVAPDPWQKVEGNDEWYTYKKIFHPERSCENLFFNRVRILNGMNLNLGINQTHNDLKNFSNIIATTLMRTLNITLVEKKVSKLEQIKKMQLELILITINRPFYQYSMTYPIVYSGNYVLSHHSELLSPLEKIGNFYGIICLIATIMILLITFIVIFFSSGKKSLSFAFFEILKLLINSAIKTNINSLSLKIFFLMVFLYFLIIHATFEGNLAKFLTKPEFQQNIDSFKDLKNSLNVYKIFTGLDKSKSLSELLKNAKFEVRVGSSCVENVLHDASAICIDDYLNVLEGAVQYDLHLSKKPIDTIKPLAFLVRNKWPVRQRINDVLMSIEHSGLSKVWSKKLTKLANTYQRQMQARSNIPFKPITVDVLGFAFIFLLVGLICASVCFIIEIIHLIVIKKEKKILSTTKKAEFRKLHISIL